MIDKKKLIKDNFPVVLVFMVFTLISALSINFRFYNFNGIPLFEKLVNFIATSMFAAVLINNYFVSGIASYFKNPKKNYILGAAIGVTALVFILIPYLCVPLKTLHTLTISVPETSAPIVIYQVQDSDNSPVVLDEFKSLDSSQDFHLSSGQSVHFQRNMLGGMTIIAYANNSPSEIDVTWDGVTTRQLLRADSTQNFIYLDGSSLGKPDTAHMLFLIINITSDVFSCFFLFLALFQLLSDHLQKKQVLPEEQFALFPKARTDFVVIQLFLFFLAKASLDFQWIPEIVAMYILLGSWIFWGLLSWFRKTELSMISGLFLIVAAVSIICNICFFPKMQAYNPKVSLKANNSFPELVNFTLTDITNEISVNYYKQMDQSSLIIDKDILARVNFDPKRFLDINHAKSAQVEDYPSELTTNQYKRLLQENSLLSSPYNINIRNQSGMIYLLDDPENIGKKYITYQYKKDIFFLSPEAMEEFIH